MKAYALVQDGPRGGRKVLCISDSTIHLWITGAAMLRKGSMVEDDGKSTLKQDTDTTNYMPVTTTS